MSETTLVLELKPDAPRIVACLIILLVMDSVWFTLTRKKLYSGTFDPNHVDLRYGLLAWGVLSGGISAFRAETPLDGAKWGAFVGLLGYGVFNGTEAALRPDWRRRPIVIVSDMLWGITACSVAGAALAKML
jgi:uncharacterized membrane protein